MLFAQSAHHCSAHSHRLVARLPLLLEPFLCFQGPVEIGKEVGVLGRVCQGVRCLLVHLGQVLPPEGDNLGHLAGHVRPGKEGRLRNAFTARGQDAGTLEGVALHTLQECRTEGALQTMAPSYAQGQASTKVNLSQALNP
jgi:hypothetical protein